MATSNSAFSAARAAALSCCLGGMASPGAAAQAPPQETVHYLTYENDTFFHTDRFYTNGVQWSIKHSGDRRGRIAQAWTDPLCRWFGCDDARVLTSQFNVGQLMYTPSNITERAPQPLDRPWAGLLYYEQVYAFLSPDQRTLTTLNAQLGVTGPAALAEPAQKLLHRVFDRPRPEGWDNQIGGSLALLASAERRSAVDPLSFELGREVRFNTAAYWRVAVGSIATYAAGGLAIVVGKDLPLVSPPPPGIGNKIGSGALPGALTSCLTPWLQCTAFGSVEARVVAYNLFLDGRPWRDDPRVKRRNVVRDLQVGMRFDLPRTRTAAHGPWFLQLKVTRRSPEFKSSIPLPRHTVGAVTIGTEF